MSLLTQLQEDMKAAMRAKEKDRLGAVRLIIDSIKKAQLTDEGRVELTDEHELQLLDKMVKQRRDSIKQYNDAGRPELAAKESFEITIIQGYLPEPLTEDEVNTMIREAISETGAESMKDMGKVMAILRPKAQGRTDMGQLAGLIKTQLG